MSCKALKLKGCEVAGSTFQGRKFTFTDRQINEDTFFAKVYNFQNTLITEIQGVKNSNDVYFSFVELENQKIGSYKIEYWANLKDIAIEMIAIESFKISSEPCDCDDSNDVNYTLEIKEESINYSLSIAVTGGKSAYEIAVENGYIGTEPEWLISLKGADGYTPIKGVDYFDGKDGVDGAKGDKGDKGDKGEDAQITFATQSEMESQTPPDTENNKAVSLFGLWKWVKKLNYLYLNITTANSVLNKIWYDGLNAWVTNKDGVNKQLAYDGDSVRRIDGTFNPPTQAQLTSLGIKRGDFYQNTTTNQRAMYNGNQLIEWTVTTAEYNALSTDQKNAVKNLSIIIA